MFDDEVQEKLRREFPKEIIKKRQGPGNRQFDYVPTAAVINRLNDAFDFNWSFMVLDLEEKPSEIIVHGQLTVEGIVKQQYGGQAVSGRMSKSDAFKSAASDALKKCASLFGVALHLYTDDELESPAEPTPSRQSSQQQQHARRGAQAATGSHIDDNALEDEPDRQTSKEEHQAELIWYKRAGIDTKQLRSAINRLFGNDTLGERGKTFVTWLSDNQRFPEATEKVGTPQSVGDLLLITELLEVDLSLLLEVRTWKYSEIAKLRTELGMRGD